MDPKPPTNGVMEEEASARRERIRSLYMVHTCMLIFSFGYSVVLTGVLPYLRRLTSMDEDSLIELFGWMVAINPIGQMIFSPPLGWLTNKIGSIRGTCLITSAMFIAGNLIYSCLSLLPDTEKGWYRAAAMLFGRLLVGIGTANQAPIRAYIAGATFSTERNFHMSMLSLFQTLGFMAGPIVQMLLALALHCSPTYNPGQLRLDQYTSTGWFSVALGLLSLLSFSPWTFKEYNVAVKEAEQLNTEADTNQDLMSMKPDLVALSALIVAFFVLLFNFILLETIGTPICMQQLGWDEETSITNLGIIMALGAVVSLVCFATVPMITSRVDERIVLLLMGLVPMFLARLVALPPFWGDPPKLLNDTRSSGDRFMYGASLRNVHCDTGEGEAGCPYDWCVDTPAMTAPQFYVHYAISSASFPYCTAICQALFSKVVGPRPQGVWMGILTAAGSLARICGPVFVSEIYKEFGTYWTYGLTAVSIAIAIAGTLLTYRRLVPMETRLKLVPMETRPKLENSESSKL